MLPSLRQQLKPTTKAPNRPSRVVIKRNPLIKVGPERRTNASANVPRKPLRVSSAYRIDRSSGSEVPSKRYGGGRGGRAPGAAPRRPPESPRHSPQQGQDGIADEDHGHHVHRDEQRNEGQEQRARDQDEIHADRRDASPTRPAGRPPKKARARAAGPRWRRLRK
jgi:hypothetical protein